MAKRNVKFNRDNFVDCSQLAVGQEVKNYGALCELLKEKQLTGNSKKAQLKRWENYFSYEKRGQKFIINELYESPLSRVDGRKLKAGVYVNYIECLLMDYEMTANETVECRRELNGKIADSMSALADKRKAEFDERYSWEQFDDKLPNKQNYWAMKRHNHRFVMNALAKEKFREIQDSLIDYLIRIE